jgi:hypothetical protein
VDLSGAARAPLARPFSPADWTGRIVCCGVPASCVPGMGLLACPSWAPPVRRLQLVSQSSLRRRCHGQKMLDPCAPLRVRNYLQDCPSNREVQKDRWSAGGLLQRGLRWVPLPLIAGCRQKHGFAGMTRGVGPRRSTCLHPIAKLGTRTPATRLPPPTERRTAPNPLYLAAVPAPFCQGKGDFVNCTLDGGQGGVCQAGACGERPPRSQAPDRPRAA